MLGGNSNDGRLLQEIEALSHALSLNNNKARKNSTSFSDYRLTSPRSPGSPYFDPKTKAKAFDDIYLESDKKSSVWKWKSLKALSGSRGHRYNCCFSLQVHGIVGLPSSFNGHCLCVHWKRKTGGLQTKPARVFLGMVEFDENLLYKCSIYGSKHGPHRSARYESKYFDIVISIVGVPNLVLGNHRVDLTRLLPLSLEELEGDKNSGRWSTSFRLSGRAKGASLRVSFGYSLIADDLNNQRGQTTVGNLKSRKENDRFIVNSPADFDLDDLISFHPTGSPRRRSRSFSQPKDTVRVLHEVYPNDQVSVSTQNNQVSFDDKLNQSVLEKEEKLDLKSVSLSAFDMKEFKYSCDDIEFNVSEKGTECVMKDPLISLSASIQTAGNPEEENINREENIVSNNHLDQKCSNTSAVYVLDLTENKSFDSEAITENENIISHHLSIPRIENVEPEKYQVICNDGIKQAEVETDCKSRKSRRSLSLDEDSLDSIAREFLEMVGMDRDSECHAGDQKKLERNPLVLDDGHFVFPITDDKNSELDHTSLVDYGWKDFCNDFELSTYTFTTTEKPNLTRNSKHRGRMLENEELKSLVREWGLDEKFFENSLSENDGGFGSPIDIPPEESLHPAPVPLIKINGGGYVHSMNPLIFRNSKNNGGLNMQCSVPVVLPEEIGHDIIDILQYFGSYGIDNFVKSINNLMPWEDITGMTTEEMKSTSAHDTQEQERKKLSSSVEQGAHSLGICTPSPTTKFISALSTNINEKGTEFFSLDDFPHVVMNKIETLSIEGLKIYSGMADIDAPSKININPPRKISDREEKISSICRSIRLEGALDTQLIEMEDKDQGGDLLDLSITLDEWMQLDSRMVGKEEMTSRLLKILVAHHATYLDVSGNVNADSNGISSSRGCLLGARLLLAMMVQLRDPLRDNEPVGSPMLSLVCVERDFLNLKPKIYDNISDHCCEEENEAKLGEVENKNKMVEDVIPYFRITEVHVVGIETKLGNKHFWNTEDQKRSGYRWLLSSGMGHRNISPFLNIKSVEESLQISSLLQSGASNTMWSISSHFKISGEEKRTNSLGSFTRNPDIIF